MSHLQAQILPTIPMNYISFNSSPQNVALYLAACIVSWRFVAGLSFAAPRVTKSSTPLSSVEVLVPLTLFVTFAHQVTVRSLSLNGLQALVAVWASALGVTCHFAGAAGGASSASDRSSHTATPSSRFLRIPLAPKIHLRTSRFAEKQHACSISCVLFLSGFPFHYTALV